MAALIAFAFLIGGGITLVVLRISVSCMFWFSKNPNDKVHVFKTQFPYYMMLLFATLTAINIITNFEIYIFIYSICTYALALLIWNFKLKHCTRTYDTTISNLKPQHPELP